MSRNHQSDSSPVDQLFGKADRRVRRLAVFGPKGSGKTCFFASIYGHSADSFSSLTFDHAPTTDYLEKMWRAYRHGKDGFPDPNPAEVPARLIFHMADQKSGRQWQSEILDHAGELVHRIPCGSGDRKLIEDLRGIVQTWLRECEAILIFLDTTQAESEDSLERRNEVSNLLQLCREASESGNVTRPIGLVLTKWDSLSSRWTAPLQADNNEQPASDTDLQAKFAREEQIAKEYLARTPSLRQIHQTVEAFGKTVIVFPVSAIGFNRQARQNPTDPFNTLTPLLWALRQTDESRAKSAESKAEHKPKSLSKAVQAYQDLVDLDGITCGPVYNEIEPRLKELKNRLKKRRAVIFATSIATAFTLLSILFGGIYYVWSANANRQYEAWADFCKNEHKANAGKRLAMANDLIAWHGTVLSHKQRAELDRRRLIDQVAERDYLESTDWEAIEQDKEALKKLPDPPQQIEVRENLKRKLESFGKKHKEFKFGPHWENELDEVQRALVKQYAERDDFEKTAAKEKQTTDSVQTANLINLWVDYLASQPTKYYENRAKRRLSSLEDRYDDQVLDQFQLESRTPRQNDAQFATFIQKVDDFVTKDRKNKNRKDIEIQIDKLVDAELSKEDEWAYNQAADALSTAKTIQGVSNTVVSQKLVIAQQKVDDYLAPKYLAGRERKRSMITEANLCANWFRMLTARQRVEICEGAREKIWDLVPFRGGK